MLPKDFFPNSPRTTMPNKPFPDAPKDKVLGPYPWFVYVSENLWLVFDKEEQCWAAYAPEQGRFLSPFMYTDYELPNGKAPLLCCLFTKDRAVHFHIEGHFCPLC